MGMGWKRAENRYCVRHLPDKSFILVRLSCRYAAPLMNENFVHTILLRSGEGRLDLYGALKPVY